MVNKDSISQKRRAIQYSFGKTYSFQEKEKIQYIYINFSPTGKFFTT